MRRIFVQIISMQYFLILFMSCNIKEPRTDSKAKSIDTLLTENFESFLHKFYRDSNFQKSRIIFPLRSETSEEREKEIKEAKELNMEIDAFRKFTPYNKNNWIMVTDSSFGNDSVSVCRGVNFKRRFYKTDNFVEENILYADPEQVMIIMKFQLINKKWYMVDFQDEFEHE